MWEAWRLSQALGARPSEIYHIHDELQAFCFDRAVATFGQVVDADIDKAIHEGKNKASRALKIKKVMDAYLGVTDGASGFRDPAKG